MKSKSLISTILLVLFLVAAMPICAMADPGSVSVEVPFTVENTPGTVVIDAQDGAPLPAQTEFSDTQEGSFSLTFTEPGYYAYKVYQKQGLDDYTAYYEFYDDTEYDVVVSVFTDDDNDLSAYVTVSIPGDAFKPDGIVFTNDSETAELSIRKAQALGSGTPTTQLIYVQPDDEITYFITVSNNTKGSVYDVTVKDEIPAGLELVKGSISNEGTEADRVISWDLGTMGPGKSITVSFTTTVPKVTEATTWTNIAAGTFINQTGRVSINTLSLGFGVRAATSIFAPQVIELDTNDVKAVYEPEEPTTAEPTTAEPTTAEPTTAEPTTAQPTTAEPTTSAGSRPYTGDNNNLPLWITIGAVSLGLMIIFVILYRKEHDKDNEQDCA